MVPCDVAIPFLSYKTNKDVRMQAQKRKRHVIQRWFDVRQRWWSAEKAKTKEGLRTDRKRPPNLVSDRVVPAKV